MSDPAATPDHPYRRVVLKVWERDGILCDNAADIDFLDANKWTLVCTERLSSDERRGECAVLYVMKPPNAIPQPNPSGPTVTFPTYVPVKIPAPSGATVAVVACSMTKGRMIVRPFDDSDATHVVEIGPSPTASFPFPAAGVFAVQLNSSDTPPPRYVAVMCVNDSGPPDVDPSQPVSPDAVVHVEVSFPNLSVLQPPPPPPGSNPFVAVAGDRVPTGLTRMYYLVISFT
jgi:hypothetical protein